MGKDIYLDNGKKVQGSMARYWKQQKQRQKNKDRTRNPRNNQKQQTDQYGNKAKQSVSNHDKWKIHQQNMITKKYASNQVQSKQKVQVKQQPVLVNQSQDVLLKQVDAKQTIIPGYSSKSQIHKKIHKTTVQKSKQTPLSNKQIPPQLAGLFGSPQQLQKILLANKQKNLQKLQKQKDKKQRQRLQAKQKTHDPFQKTLQDQSYNPLRPKQQDQKLVQQQAPIVQKQFFKSDILNQISKGIQPKLNVQIIQQKQQKQQVPLVPLVPNIVQQQSQQKSYRFIPRSVLLKK